ncbi:MAG: hypothetical protein ABI147_05445 [Acidobacteriaceae bacterium]
MKALILLAVAAPAFGQVSITQQPADQAAIPGSVRSLYANVQGTKNLTVTWATTGGCTLATPTTTAAPQIVTAPATGSACKYVTTAPSNEAPSFRSATSCTVTAASAEDPSKTASIVIPVCSPQVLLTAFPMSTVLYKDQFAVIQSDLRGSVDTSVTWAITTNPGRAGVLTGGASNRHAIFSAKAPGTYVLTTTSVADRRKTAATTIYVTSNNLPAPNTDHTEAVDCTATGKGKTYEVGPERKFHDLNAISWNSLGRGDTVRIHNDDTTGSSPTTYHQRVSIAVGGNASEPLRICGVPDAHGVKPIIDGENATTRSDENWAKGSLEGLGVVTLYDAFHKFDVAPDGNENVIIEGLHIRNANLGIKYVKSDNSGPGTYTRGAACIRVQTGRAILIRGNELDNCTQAVFTNAQTPEGSIIYDLTVEGNYIHAWGVPKIDRQHGVYLQAIGLAVQFNYFGAPAPETLGNVIKSRSVMNFLRWNYISQTASTARAFDLIEPQAFTCTVIPYSFAYRYHGLGGAHTDCNAPHRGPGEDTLSADQVAANFEAYHSDYIYGNIVDDAGAGSGFVHYGYDQQTVTGSAFDRRGGTLYYWNNTHLSRKAIGMKLIFDSASPDQGVSYEFPSIVSVNNVFASSGSLAFIWNRAFWTRITVNSNWISPGSILPNRSSKDSYQGGTSASEMATCDPYGNCKASNGHMVWQRDGKAGTEAATLYVGETPFNVETFVPTSRIHGGAAHLPQAIQDQPSNMEYFPATNTIAPRKDETFLGALD